MNIITKYLLKKYIKYFLIILLSLEIFFVGIDLLQNFTKLPASANLQLLYVTYNFFYTLTITLPIALVFGWIVTITMLVKNNELVSFYALSISPSSIIKPIGAITVTILLALIFMQSTQLAYSIEQKDKILNKTLFVNEKSNIFLKYNEYFVYFKKLYPLEKKAEGIQIFQTKDTDIIEKVEASKAYYQNNRWYIIDAKITKKPQQITWSDSKLEITQEKFLYTLEGFEPSIINNVYKAKVQFSIVDAIRTILLLENQDFNTNKIKAILYSQIIMPFFFFFLIILVFIYTNASSRFFNTAAYLSITIFITLTTWGVMFLLQKLSFGNIINAELAIVLPVVLLFIITTYLYSKKVTL